MTLLFSFILFHTSSDQVANAAMQIDKLMCPAVSKPLKMVPAQSEENIQHEYIEVKEMIPILIAVLAWEKHHLKLQ